MRILMRYILLIIGYVYSAFFFIIQPLSPIIDYNIYCYLNKLQFIVNLLTAAAWISLMLSLNIKKIRKYVSLAFFLSYATMWLDFIVNHAEHDPIGLILLFHILGFVPLYIAYKLERPMKE